MQDVLVVSRVVVVGGGGASAVEAVLVSSVAGVVGALESVSTRRRFLWRWWWESFSAFLYIPGEGVDARETSCVGARRSCVGARRVVAVVVVVITVPRLFLVDMMVCLVVVVRVCVCVTTPPPLASCVVREKTKDCVLDNGALKYIEKGMKHPMNLGREKGFKVIATNPREIFLTAHIFF